jgi:hydrogenase maturation protein HypF
MKKSMGKNELIGKSIHIQGIVQGVGFRPFIYSLAQKHHITGWVRNSTAGVDIIANGNPGGINSFIADIRQNPPPLAKIDHIDIAETEPDGFQQFEIHESDASQKGFIPISPDISICQDCLDELFDPSNRRYRYPFINCTNCGPRFTIINDIPYDRPLTTMASFELCPQCKAEYHDPLDRRFHAQPVACTDCGPQVWFEDALGAKTFTEDAIQTARRYLKEGRIIAVKGLGGFHLACDAGNAEAVEELRRRKKRSQKSFAVMVFDTATAEKYCHIEPAERDLLTSKEKPIVILEENPDADLPEAIAPGLHTLGVMLPYTPLHYLLLEPEPGYPDIFIMTSGNISEEPIAYTNQSAKSDLADIADGYLLNDRDINIRVDDSVVAEVRGGPYFFRRSRGFAPNPLKPGKTMREVLAVGAELKNTFCLTKDEYAFVSHHIGDLENLETLQAFEASIPHYEHIFKVSPTAIAADMHPDYMSSRYAQQRAQAENLPLIQIQHHHAHLAACLADNTWQEDESVIGVILDGTGLGLDGKIWGGEFLYGNYTGFERLSHLAYYPLPGGDLAVMQPKRLAAAYLKQAGLEWDNSLAPISALSAQEKVILNEQIEKDINCPQTSSMGRLFDAVSSLIGLCQEVNYEAQAAIELEQSIAPNVNGSYKFDIRSGLVDPAPLLGSIISDLQANLQPGIIAAKFHNAVVDMLVEVCLDIKNTTNCTSVAFSGGVWQNLYLLKRSIKALESKGFKVLAHKQVPPNDGCIALGQALIANHHLK